ncbi:acyl-CoA synthetase [Parvibaculum sp.]|uniref:acyl-CoA synthetase n=1 Tax=Parvibaculum sp. TaxID=2024848 RepID=UPI002BCF326D|nr:acyl-CoA synthetase [Parvibaculum sp.]HUD50156.1 acyl-CoA synthetase [Parvibaculum sp.]
MSLLAPKIARGYSGEACPVRFNMARYCLARAAVETPAKTALIVVSDAEAPLAEAEHWSYGALDDAVRRIAAGLFSEGFRPGERLMIRMPNTSDYALLFFGAIAAGLVPLPSSSQLTETEADFLLKDSHAAAVAIAGDMEIHAGKARIIDAVMLARLKAHPPLGDYADTEANDPAFLVYTSGTSGKPKGVLHAQRSAWGRRPMYQGWYGIGPDDVVLHAGAFNWTYTLGVGLTDPWANGATTVLYIGPKDVQVWPKLLERTRATLFAAVPTLYRQILKYCDLGQHDLSALRHGLTAGEALSPALLDQWHAATGKKLCEALGMSECSTYISTGPRMEVKPGSPGKPQPGRCVAVLPVEGGTEPLPVGKTGLLAVHRSDPGLMLGYWQRPEEETEVYRGEWFIGGDLASFDKDGYLWYHGRADDVMNAMGYRVSPAEVEAALSDHPDVAEVAVTELHVRDDVSVIAAFVVPKDGARPDAASILTHAETRLAAYKRPREIVFVETLPRTANGKVMRRALAAG